MKLVVSSYQKNPNESLSLYEFKNNEFTRLGGLSLYEPSFVISYLDYVFTYDKTDLRIVCLKVINNHFEFVSEIKIPGKTLTHLAYNPKYQKLYAASYADGAYLVCDCVDGVFKQNSLKYFYRKTDLDKCHFVGLSPDSDKVLLINIGLDKLFIFDNDLNLLNEIILPEKVGPRHAIWDKNIYIITEYSNEVIVLKEENNNYKIIQRISTLKENIKSSGATLVLSSDKKKLFASNRGEDSICCYNVIDGLLEYEKTFSCYGNHPRHMVLQNICDKDYIFSCNKNSNELVVINEIGKVIARKDYQLISCLSIINNKNC